MQLTASNADQYAVPDAPNRPRHQDDGVCAVPVVPALICHRHRGPEAGEGGEQERNRSSIQCRLHHSRAHCRDLVVNRKLTKPGYNKTFHVGPLF